MENETNNQEMEFDSYVMLKSNVYGLREFPPEVELAVRHAIDDYCLNGELPELEGVARGIWEMIFVNLKNARNKRIAGAAKQNSSDESAQQEKKQSERKPKRKQTESKPGAESEQNPSRLKANPEQTESKPGTMEDGYMEDGRGNRSLKDSSPPENSSEFSAPQGADAPDALAQARVIETEPKEKPKTTKAQPRTKPFKPPSVEDVQAYATELGHTEFDATYFVDHYEGNGWMVGRNKMRDWKATVRNWIRRDQNGEFAGAAVKAPERRNNGVQYGGGGSDTTAGNSAEPSGRIAERYGLTCPDPELAAKLGIRDG